MVIMSPERANLFSARRSWHERYPADSHGHFQEAVGLAALLDG
jgi:hypothetical protein